MLEEALGISDVEVRRSKALLSTPPAPSALTSW